MSEPTNDTERLPNQTTSLGDGDINQIVSVPHMLQLREDDDADSTLGMSTGSSDTSSLSDSDTTHVYENGREYHGFHQGIYPFPCDEREMEYQDIFHHMLRLILNGDLYRAPIESPVHVLDLGTGTGMWASDIAYRFPNSIVEGIDLAAIQPTNVPQNCSFFLQDFEEEWPHQYAEYFDYIHGRGLSGSVSNWDQFFSRAYQSLRTGGWMEMQENPMLLHSHDDTTGSMERIQSWQFGLHRASRLFGKPFYVAHLLKKQMEDAGFVDVHEEVYHIPVGQWAANPQFKEVGLCHRKILVESVESLTLALYTRVLRYSEEEVRDMIKGVIEELVGAFRNESSMFRQFFFVYGKKP